MRKQWIGVLIAGALISSLAHAQTVLEGTTYTGTKTIIGPSGAAISYDEIPREWLETNTATAADLLNQNPGINVVTSGGPGQTASIFTRGTDSDHTLVTLDGVPINDPASPGNTFFGFGMLPTSTLGAIDIIRGPSSALYGTNAIGGVINLRSFEPTRTGVNITTMGGSNETLIGAGTASYVGDQGWISITGENFYTGGYDTTRDGDREPFRSTTGVLSFGLGDDLLGLTGTLRYTNSQFEYDPAPGQNGEGTNNQLFGRLTGNWQMTDDLLIKATFAHFDFDREVRYGPTIAGNGDLSDYTGTRTFFSTQADWQVNEQLLWSFGTETVRDSAQTRVTNLSLWGNYTGSVNESEINNALWTQGQFDITPNWSVNGQVRLNLPENYDATATYRIGSSYLIDATGTRLFASYGTAFKAPSLDDRFGVYAFGGFPSFQGNPDLRPETSWTVEGGIEQTFDAGSLKLTGWYTSIEDMITYTPTFDTLTNLDTAETYGLELQGKWSVTDQLSLTGAYTYTEALNGNGDRLLRRPRHMVYAGAELTPIENLTLTAGVTGHFDVRDVDSVTFAEIDGDNFLTLDVGASYRFSENATLFVKGSNLTNVSYQPVDGFYAPGAQVFAGLNVSF